MARFSDLLGGDEPARDDVGPGPAPESSATGEPGTEGRPPLVGSGARDGDGDLRRDSSVFARLAREQHEQPERPEGAEDGADAPADDVLAALGLDDLPPVDDDLLPRR